MDFIINFFRDILDGTTYTIVSIVCGILICSCIGYLGERYLKKREALKEFNKTHVSVNNGESNNNSIVNSDAK